MKQKIKNLATKASTKATLAAFLTITAIGANCVREYHHYHPIEVREEPIKQPNLKIEIPVVVKVEQPKTIEQKVEHGQKQILEVPGKETIYETGNHFVVLELERCAQQAEQGKREGNHRLPYKVWAFKPRGSNPMRKVGIGSSIIRVCPQGDTTVTGTSREKAQEIWREARERCYKQAYIDLCCPQ